MQELKLKSLKEWAEFFENRIPASTLRAEIQAGRIRCIRARPSCNAPILVSEREIARWLEEVAGTRQRALSPTEARKGNKAAGHDE